jgi:ribosomal protein S18 acetylase RimI-like enzyme
MTEIQKIKLPMPGIDLLRQEALEEGYRFLDTLVEEWANGENRFDSPGEMLCGCIDHGLLVAVGGINRDPFLSRPDVGRIRRVYVKREWRNRGIGETLVRSLLNSAQKSFRRVRLRAESQRASRLYERMGFSAITDPDATHILTFD